MPDFLKAPPSAHRTLPQSPPRLNDYLSTRDHCACAKGGRSVHPTQRGTLRGLVTAITVVRNSAATIQRTISSIREQSYPHIEYIIIDGGSTDGTLEILHENETHIDFWMSEADRGISDAFNKGIALALGEFILLVNADDWLNPDHVTRSIEHLNQSGADFVFGNLTVHDANGSPLYTVIGDEQYYRHVRYGMPALNHPTIVCRRSLYERNGLYDLRYRIAMDYEWLLRNHLRGAVGKYVPSLLGHMGAEGISQRRVRASLQEVRRISIAHGYPTTLAFFRYHGRLMRAYVRQVLERSLSPALVDRLHARLNRSYRPSDSKSISGQ